MRNLFLKLWCFVVERLVGILAGLLVALLVIFVLVMFCETCTEWVGECLGLYTKNPILKFLGIGMGGVLLALQALMSYKRAKALEDTANAQAEAAKAQAKATEEQAKANEKTEQGQRQERLKNAIEHLGHDKDSVRLGGAYELFHLAEETKEWRQTILDILCAHIRQTTGEDEYRKKYRSKPSEEIQSLLTLLFVQEYTVFRGLLTNLQGSWLNGANLSKAHLEGATLTGAYLRAADLEDAWMQAVDLREAHLQVAIFEGTHLQAACLLRAQMQGAHLIHTQLQRAYLRETALQEAQFYETHLEGVTSRVEPYVPYAFDEVIRSYIGKKDDLSGIIFSGGLSQEDVHSFSEGAPVKNSEWLRITLEAHTVIQKRSELPENSHAVTGTYTAEEAEQWIAEYNEAMSEVPEESDN